MALYSEEISNELMTVPESMIIQATPDNIEAAQTFFNCCKIVNFTGLEINLVAIVNAPMKGIIQPPFINSFKRDFSGSMMNVITRRTQKKPHKNMRFFKKIYLLF